MSDAATVTANAKSAQARKHRRAQALPTIPDPGDTLDSVVRSVRAIKALLEVLARQRGAPVDDEFSAILRYEFESLDRRVRALE
jgi:hypothetical protein